MAEEHIPFSESDFDNRLDQSHLNSCEECQKKWAVFRFLGFQVRSAPEMDPPPFFTQRVARLVQTPKDSFAFLFQRVAQQLVPVFMVLVLATSVLLYWQTEAEPAMEDYSAIFFDQPVPEEFSVQDVVDSLREHPGEELVP